MDNLTTQQDRLLWSSSNIANLEISGITVLTVQFNQSFSDILYTVHGDGNFLIWKITKLENNDSQIGCIANQRKLRNSFSKTSKTFLCSVLNRIKCTFEGYELRTAGCSRHGERFLIGGSDGQILLFLSRYISKNNLYSNTNRTKLNPPLLHVLEGHHGQITCHAFNPFGTDFVTGSWDGTVFHWFYNIDSFSWQATILKCHDNQETLYCRCKVTTLCFNSDGSMIIACSSDAQSNSNQIFAWSTLDHQRILFSPLHESEIYVLCAHPYEPGIFITGSFDGLIAIWAINSKKPHLCKLYYYYP